MSSSNTNYGTMQPPTPGSSSAAREKTENLSLFTCFSVKNFIYFMIIIFIFIFIKLLLSGLFGFFSITVNSNANDYDTYDIYLLRHAEESDINFYKVRFYFIFYMFDDNFLLFLFMVV